jgi:carbon storage regulator CsrA
VGESILIDGKILVTVIEYSASKGKVKLGIEAPREVPVDRLEVAHARARDAKAKGDQP